MPLYYPLHMVVAYFIIFSLVAGVCKIGLNFGRRLVTVLSYDYYGFCLTPIFLGSHIFLHFFSVLFISSNM